MIKNTFEAYGLIAKLFHWIMALILIGLVILGLTMVELPFGVQKLKLYRWHKEYGILILLLVTLRLLWRWGNIVPLLPLHLPWWQKWAAHGVHYAFYALMFALPLTGWALSSAAGLPVSFFGLFVLPDWVKPNEALRITLSTVHRYFAYLFIAVLCAHVGAALIHHFYYKDNILRRMIK